METVWTVKNTHGGRFGWSVVLVRLWGTGHALESRLIGHKAAACSACRRLNKGA